MKISNEESLRAARVEPVAPAQAPGTQSAAASVPGNGPAASVEVSAQAKTLAASKADAARYLPAVEAAPETRDDLVARLKAQVDSGSYHVPAADIAEQLVRRVQADNIR